MYFSTYRVVPLVNNGRQHFVYFYGNETDFLFFGDKWLDRVTSVSS